MLRSFAARSVRLFRVLCPLPRLPTELPSAAAGSPWPPYRQLVGRPLPCFRPRRGRLLPPGSGRSTAPFFLFPPCGNGALPAQAPQGGTSVSPTSPGWSVKIFDFGSTDRPQQVPGKFKQSAERAAGTELPSPFCCAAASAAPFRLPPRKNRDSCIPARRRGLLRPCYAPAGPARPLCVFWCSAVGRYGPCAPSPAPPCLRPPLLRSRPTAVNFPCGGGWVGY